MENKQISWLEKIKANGELAIILAVTGMVLMMVIPLPPFLLDSFLVGSIGLAILILLVGFYSNKPLDFSVFPTMLLFATLFRLTLNIASTRLILLNGSKGSDAAGFVIQAFGDFVAGGSYVVGLIVFIILVLINFVVITKGAGRIAEVAARFTLDSMPGKQLAIDADLNAGIITDKEAKERRKQLESESDFYGAMDGASKFVRGDAIAGIIITLVNIIGGFIIGMAQQGLGFEKALSIYTILSVGDGLVTQIPALIISVAAGVIVTKVSKDKKVSGEIYDQLLRRWRPLALAGTILFLMALVPSLPTLPFLFLGSAFGGAAYFLRKSEIKKEKEEKTKEPLDEPQVQENKSFIPPLDILELEVGYDLISLVDQNTGGEFPARIMGIRKQFANEMGIILPPVHIRDNLKLKPTEYKIYLKGAVVGEADLMPHHVLALDPGMTTKKIEGIPTKDPTFGLDAYWIADDKKEDAVVAGYTVVDLASVMATHLIEIVRHHLHEIFGRQELDHIIEQVKLSHPRVVNDLIPDLLPFGVVLKVIQNLLKERVSVRDMLSILETLAENAGHTKDSEELTEFVRVALGRSIAQQHLAQDENLYVITLDRETEEKLMQSIHPKAGGSQIAIEPSLARSLVEKIGEQARQYLGQNQPPVVLTAQKVRPYLYRLIEKFIPNLSVLAHSEVAGHVTVKPLSVVGISS